MDHDSSFLSLSGMPRIDYVIGHLRAARDEVLRDWVERVRKNESVDSERALRDPLLLDHVPQLFDAIVDRLELYRDRDDAEHFAAVHGFGRRLSGYDVVETVIELFMFRRAIWAQLSDARAPAESVLAVMERIDGMLDRAAITSLTAYLDPSAGMLVRVANPSSEPDVDGG